MSNYQGYRFFVDVKNDNQYAVQFEFGMPVDILAVDSKTNQLVPMDRLFDNEVVMVDDETNELYRMDIKPVGPGRAQAMVNGIPDDKDPAKNKTMDSLPPHHPNGATIARSIIDAEQKQAKDLTDMFKDMFGGGGLPSGMGQEEDDNFVPPKREPAPETTPSGARKPGMKAKPSGGYKVSDTALEKVLHKFGQDLTERAKRGELDPIIGRDKELGQLKQFLLRKNKSSVNLIGEPGTGKTAMFDALALDIVAGNAEEELADARVIALDITGMNATDQAKYRGQFEKELKKVLDGLEERGGYINGQKVVLCLDEIHSVLGAGAVSGNEGGGAAQIMKPFLARGSVTCIGTTTLKEHKKFVEKDGALNRRFQPLVIEPTDSETTLVILKKLNEHYGRYHGMEQYLTDEQLEKIVKLTDRFMPQQFQPDKSVGVLDDAMAIARMAQRKDVLDSDIITAVSKASKLKEEFLNQKDHERFVKLEKELPQEVLGQDEQLEAITQRLIAARAGLTDPNQPWGAFLLAGPTGVGKTETARMLAKHLNGTEDAMIKIDMNNYMDKHAVSKLIGAPAGFVGHDDTEPELEKVRQKPYSVVVFDEVEKAHPDVFNILLPILEDGEVEDQKGNMISFKNTVIIMTTNLGAGQADKPSIIEKDTKQDRDRVYMGAINKHFRPELLGRLEGLGGILVYNRLSEDVLGKILEREVDKVAKRLNDTAGGGLQLRNVEMELTEEVRDKLIAAAAKSEKGARPVKGMVSKDLSQPLAGWLMKKKVEYAEASKDGAKVKDKTLRALFEQESKAKIIIDSIGKDMEPKVEVVELAKPKKEEKKELVKETVSVAEDKTEEKEVPVTKGANDNKRDTLHLNKDNKNTNADPRRNRRRKGPRGPRR